VELPWRPNDQHVRARDLRASDADRERVVALLREACGDGRLTADEHAERVEGAYTARTLGELTELTADLAAPEQQPIQVGDGPMFAAFRTVRRAGRWVVPAGLPVSALFGTVEIDLREALLQRRHVVVRAAMLAGRLRLVVPEGVRVEFTGRSVLGTRDLRVRPSYGDDTPLVEVSGVVVLGSVHARTPKRRRRWSLGRRTP
jgi:hypothetical protein